MTNLAPLMTSTRPDWNTPECMLERVRRIDTIGLDPCSNATSIVHARREWDGLADQDGLSHVWLNYGLVYVNPPYGRGIIAWAKKMADEGVNGAEIVALLPARTDARWWQDYVAQAAAICFWRGRLRFLGAPASAPFPSAVAYWGQRHVSFKRAFGTAGWMVHAGARKGMTSDGPAMQAEPKMQVEPRGILRLLSCTRACSPSATRR